MLDLWRNYRLAFCSSPWTIRNRVHDKVLLTIGNNNYQTCCERCHWKPLEGAVKDSHYLRDYCQSCGWLVFGAQDVDSPDLMMHHAKQANSCIGLSTSVAIFHYSGHAADIDGATYLIPCKPDCACADGQTDFKLNLQDLLEEFCRNLSRVTQVIVIIDGCRERPEGLDRGNTITQNGSLKDKQLLLVFACGRLRSAREVSGGGIFSLAIRGPMEKCETLPELFDEIKQNMKNLSHRHYVQDS